jgi:ribonuclease BN (tRNA processing enzyme)
MKSIQMAARFSFFKAGQGSFYGGRIWCHEKSKMFTVVYDCGTTPFITGNNQSLNNEINIFKNSLRYFPHSNEIDLLFISHLDYDHVSGLKRILTEFNVKKIVLPYIEKQQRQFFLISISNDVSQDGLLLDDYVSFIENPHTFIRETCKYEEPQIFFVISNGEKGIEYQEHNEENSPEDNIYPKGKKIETKDQNAEIAELAREQNVSIYDNNLQFFIRGMWEFTTYVKGVSNNSIEKLHDSLKKILKRKKDENLTLDDLKKIVTDKRKEAHNCYKKHIGEINSHGLVLLHGPINFEYLCGRVYSDCELNCLYHDYHYHHHFYDSYHFKNNNKIMLGTLLFGDTSINLNNNPVDFPQAFKEKLVNVHIIQVPHHGSFENWDFDEFEKLKIGNSIDRWKNRVIAVCNFGYGNKYGHPSHNVLNDLRSGIFLNSQFSRLNIEYEIISWVP